MPENDDFLFPDDPNLPPSVFGEPEVSPLNNKIKVKIISPSYPVAELAADRVLLPSVNGDIMILPDRAPIILTLRPGRLVVYNNDQKEPITFLVSKGVAEIRPEFVSRFGLGRSRNRHENRTHPRTLGKNAKNVGRGKIRLGTRRIERID